MADYVADIVEMVPVTRENVPLDPYVISLEFEDPDRLAAVRLLAREREQNLNNTNFRSHQEEGLVIDNPDAETAALRNAGNRLVRGIMTATVTDAQLLNTLGLPPEGAPVKQVIKKAMYLQGGFGEE